MTTSVCNRRFVLVMGKGGVGRSTVTAALAIAAGRAGLHTCIAELYGQDQVAKILGLQERDFGPRPCAPNVAAMSLTPAECLEDFARRKLKLDRILGLLITNRVVSSFIDAVPGLHDILQLGKIENLLLEPLSNDPKFDLVIVDAPATGHGLTLLSGARTLTDMARVGPFHELANSVVRLLADPEKSAVVLVTLPEELPVNETLELIEALGVDRALLAGVVVNQVRGPVLPPTPPWNEVRRHLANTRDPDLQTLLELVQPLVEQQTAQGAAIERLKARIAPLVPPPLALLPHIGPHELGAEDLRYLATVLEKEWPIEPPGEHP